MNHFQAENYGKAYIIIGKAYATYGGDCESFKETIERSSVFWAEVDKFNKAKTANKTLTI